MPQPPQDARIGLPQGVGFRDRGLQALDVGSQVGLLGRHAPAGRARSPCNAHAPEAGQPELEHDGHHGDDQQPDPDPAQVGHSFVSLSSIPATGAIATTWSSAVRRITITPWVWRPIREMAPTAVRSTMPLALISSTSSSGSVTTRTAASLPTRSVILSVKTPWPPRWCIGYSARGVRLP